jgi:hypothetical protein
MSLRPALLAAAAVFGTIVALCHWGLRGSADLPA